MIRHRRMRASEFSRRLMRETSLGVDDLIYPVFITDAPSSVAIASMPNVMRLSLKDLCAEAEHLSMLQIPAIALFPAISADKKTATASEAWNDDGLIQQAVGILRKNHPQLGVITDIALDPYTLSGQDGLTDSSGYVLNDETIEALTKQALSHARAGADIVAPSDMMDGRIGKIRSALEQHGFHNTKILSYAAKYASAFYKPFREAVGALKQLGKQDKSTYQIDPANSNEAMRAAGRDIEEGADMIMIKPGTAYLDVLCRVKERFQAPTFVYHVSGEYAMLKAAASYGWLDERKVVMETMLAFKRAGADAILTYYAKDVAQWLQSA